MASGRTGEIEEARRVTSARLFWRVFDALDYWLMQARSSLVDMVFGSEPPTVADEMIENNRKRLREAFQEIGIAIRH
jgi:hypothetical protein